MAAWIRPQRSATSDLQRRLDHDDYVDGLREDLPPLGETGAAPSQRPTGQAAEDGISSSRTPSPAPDTFYDRLLLMVREAMARPDCPGSLGWRLFQLETELKYGRKDPE